MTNAKTTGTCPCCFGTFVVKKAVMVLHGYKRPGVGYIIGNCPATRRFKPYEISSEGTVYMRDLAVNALKHSRNHEKKLKSGKITQFSVSREKPEVATLAHHIRYKMKDSERYETIIVKKGDGQKQDFYDSREWYEIALNNAIRAVEVEIRGIENDVAFLNKKILDWKPVDLDAKLAEQAKIEAEKAKDLCPGSGTYDHDYSRMPYAYYKGGKCNHCGNFVTASSTGKMRKHPLKKEEK